MKFSIPDHVHYQDLHGEIVLLDSRSDAYLGLNHSAAIVWSALASGKTTAEAAEELVKTFGIAADVASRDVASLVADLEQRGLLGKALE